jgi:hypothetical protein
MSNIELLAKIEESTRIAAGLDTSGPKRLAMARNPDIGGQAIQGTTARR